MRIFSILQGALLTVAVSLASLLVSTVLGLLGATAKLSGRRPLVWLATLYTTVVRGIPELVLMLLVFYGAAIGINNLFDKRVYREGAGTTAGASTYNEPGRAFYASVTTSF